MVLEWTPEEASLLQDRVVDYKYTSAVSLNLILGKTGVFVGSLFPEQSTMSAGS